jgi:predicted AlkP superfamily pyrophosphatase or phosphodiesterase
VKRQLILSTAAGESQPSARVSANTPLTKLLLAIASLACLLAAHRPAAAASVLMISVDGMKPEYVTQADVHGLKIPFLRSMLAHGVYADGVTGVWPTITYPSHTTLITGVPPAEHGIYSNLEFDPKHTFADSWFWYAAQIRTPTLWQSAHNAGLKTASVGWPASVGATAVDFLIPEYWREFRPTEDLNPSDRDLIAALSRPEGMLAAMQARLGPYLDGNDITLEADAVKTRFALEILKAHKPAFMTIHLSSLDETEHEHGPFSPEANLDIEALDTMLSQLVAAARANDPDAVALIVSDHGFEPLTHKVNFYAVFARAGLIQANVDSQTHALQVLSWKAEPWPSGGMAAIMLHDPNDEATVTQVRALLHTLATDEHYGISEVLEHDAIRQRGGFPEASFLVAMKPGYAPAYWPTSLSGDAAGDTASEAVTELHGTPGGHGFSPEDPQMRASFFISGTGIAQHRDLGVIDMRRIAPTVANLLRVHLPTATAEPLPLR